MIDFTFNNPTKVYFGENAAEKHLKNALSTYGKRILMCYGGGSIKHCGIYDDIMAILKSAGCRVTEFSGIMANPTYRKVTEGAALAKSKNIDLILAVGGGSVMDCAKAISIAAVYDGDWWQDYFINAGKFNFTPIPVGAVVTVTGTGSELNGDSIITNEESRIKTGHNYIECNPAFAIIDPCYTYSVPPYQTASGGFDILSHIMEIYFSEDDNDNISDDISEALMRSVIKNLPIAIKDPYNYTARSNLSWASSLALSGLIRLGKKCDFEVHQIEHQLAAYTDCVHGAGLAVIHHVYYRHIYKSAVKRFVRFAKNVWGIDHNGLTDEAAALAGIDALEDFIRKIGLPLTISELIGEKAVDFKTVADSCNISSGSYKRMTADEIYDILMQCNG